MRRFFGFVKKEFFHIFRDYRTMIVLFGLPVIQVLIFGYAINTDLKDAHIAILDNSKDQMTRQITQKIISSGYFIENVLIPRNDVARVGTKGYMNDVFTLK